MHSLDALFSVQMHIETVTSIIKKKKQHPPLVCAVEDVKQ